MKKLLATVLAFFATVSIAFAAVNINTASQAELEKLNGIGPVKAKAIIDYRTKNGPFKTFEDVDKVPGIGQGTMDKIKKDVSLSGQTTGSAAAAKAEEKKANAKGAKIVPAKAEEAKKEDKKAEMKKEDKSAKKEEAKKEDAKADTKKGEKKADAKKDESKDEKKDAPNK
jgi:competence protein ComEA